MMLRIILVDVVGVVVAVVVWVRLCQRCGCNCLALRLLQFVKEKEQQFLCVVLKRVVKSGVCGAKRFSHRVWIHLERFE